MTLFEISGLILLHFVVCAAIVRTSRLSKALCRQHYIQRCINFCDSPIGFFGCSVLCPTIKNIRQIEMLLSCDYPRYEVIITLNPEREKELFLAVIKNYKLVKVNSSCPQEIGAPEITSLYRSRLRGYRRLIVITSDASNNYEALNTALNIASYDYIIPVSSNRYFHPHAITSLAIHLSQTHDSPELIVCDGTVPCLIFQRDALIGRGGFSADILRKFPTTSTRLTHLTLMQRIENKNYSKQPFVLLLLIALAATTIFALLFSLVFSLAILVTILFFLAAARYILILDGRQNCSVQTMLYQICNIAMFFRSRKFTIS